MVLQDLNQIHNDSRDELDTQFLFCDELERITFKFKLRANDQASLNNFLKVEIWLS